MPDPDDLEVVRAEGRRLWAEHVAATEAANLKEDPQAPDWVHDADMGMSDFFWRHGPALLAPTLTEEERRDVAFARAQFAGLASSHGGQRLLAIIDRLSGSTSTGGPTEQRFPNGYPEDPVLGPYEDAAGGPSDG